MREERALIICQTPSVIYDHSYTANPDLGTLVLTLVNKH